MSKTIAVWRRKGPGRFTRFWGSLQPPMSLFSPPQYRAKSAFRCVSESPIALGLDGWRVGLKQNSMCRSVYKPDPDHKGRLVCGSYEHIQRLSQRLISLWRPRLSCRVLLGDTHPIPYSQRFLSFPLTYRKGDGSQRHSKCLRKVFWCSILCKISSGD